MIGTRRLLVALLALALVAVTAIGSALALGGPGTVQPLDSINNPFKDVNYADMPPIERFRARDGSALAFRYYPPDVPSMKGSAVLIHGSSASSQSMHVLAKQLASEGFAAYALDIRGHGDSGTKGQISYIGQLEDDLSDFMAVIKPASPSTLVGLSAGGGFALRFASGDSKHVFQSYLLLSPFLGEAASGRITAIRMTCIV